MATRRYGSLPKDMRIAELGTTKAQLAKLTPAARKVTKGELISLDKCWSAGGKGAVPDHLTVKDLSSLGKAFPSGKARTGKFAPAIAGCTCTCRGHFRLLAK
jgi:hypothetical protein